MSRDYSFICKDCLDKVNFAESDPSKGADNDEYFFFDVGCDECHDDGPFLDVDALKVWLKKHEGHKILFGW